MNTGTGKTHIRHGSGSVRPYIFGPVALIDFVVQAFGAEIVENLSSGPDSFHVEARLGDSTFVIEAWKDVPKSRERSSIYVYVEDVDATYKRALAAGATAISAPENKPYQERAGGLKDVFGNTWYISTYTG